MNELISLIVPIYNSQMYLEKCLDSLLKQTYGSIEIILVNDGSTDNSAKICEEYAKDNKQIKVIHKKNGGLSDARNTGMKKANGSYYLFIDSDDWIEKEMVEDLLKLSKANKTDITMCTIVSESEFKTSIDEFPWKDNKIFDKSSVLKEILPRLISKIDKNGTEIEVISGSVCRCLYKAEMLKENNIFFDVSIGSGQDKEFNLRAFFKAERILTVNKPYYHYNRRTSHGGSTTQNFSPGLYENAIRRQGKYIDTLKKENLYKEFKKGLDLSLLESVIASINNLNYNNTPYNIFQRVKVTKEILRNSNFGEQIKKISKEEKVILGRNKIILLNSPFLYLSLNSMKLKIKKVVLKTR